jgi:MFS family permease
MQKSYSLKKPKVFYGYWIVVATFLFLFIFSGGGFFAFSLFVKPLQADLGWGRGEIMAAFTIYFLVMGVTMPFIGRIIYRFEVKRVIAAGGLVVGLGFASLSLMNTLWHFYLSYAVIGIGMATMGHVPSSTVVANWFKKRRGTAIGIMSGGIGAGGVALAPFIGGYFIPKFGWELSYLALGMLAWVVVIPLALLVIKTRPADMGLRPDGEESSETLAAAEALSAARGLTLRKASATSAFWLIAIAFLIGEFGRVGAIQSQVPYLEDIGFPLATASGALGGVGLGSLVGKFGFGWLCDRIAAKYACAIGFGLLVISIVILMNIEPTSSFAMIWSYSLLIGLSAGSWLPTMAMLVSTNFGLVAYGTLYSLMAFSQSIGAATGPLMAGYIFDVMASYQWAFIVFLVLAIISVPVTLAVRRPKSYSI